MNIAAFFIYLFIKINVDRPFIIQLSFIEIVLIEIY
jgi:hypothetical protein